MGQFRPIYVYFRYFLDTISIIQIEKSIDEVLGIQTRGRRMVGADKTTELWQPPIFSVSLHNIFNLIWHIFDTIWLIFIVLGKWPNIEQIFYPRSHLVTLLLTYTNPFLIVPHTMVSFSFTYLPTYLLASFEENKKIIMFLLKWYPGSVWPEKNCLMSIKVAQNDFTRRIKDFDTFT